MKITIAIVIVLFAIGLAWEIASWKECLQNHTWWYCLRILEK